VDCQMPNPNPAARVQCIDLGMLAGKLNMDPEAAEKWIVNLIRSARLSAKLDSQARPPCAAAPTRRAALPLRGPADAASARRRRFALGMLAGLARDSSTSGCWTHACVQVTGTEASAI